MPLSGLLIDLVSLVFCYYAKGEVIVGGVGFNRTHPRTIDTIERNILDLAARQGLSLYTKENSAGTLTNVALASTTKGKSGQKGDFISRCVTHTSKMD